MKDLLMLYGVTLSKRYTRKQKEFFLNYVVKLCQEKNISYELVSEHRHFMHTTNLVIGNLHAASKVIMAYYDTPQRYGLRNFRYHPFNPAKNIQQEKQRAALKVLAGILVIALLIGGHLLNEHLHFVTTNWWYVLAAIVCGIFCLLIYPKGNNINFNANSAAVAILMGCIEAVKQEDVALVLYDRGCNGYDGLKLLMDKIDKKARVLILDGIAEGEKVALAHKGMAINDLLHDGWIDKEYKDAHNALYFFEHCAMISCGKIVDHQFIIEPTRNKGDHQVNIEQLTQINKTIHRFIEGS